MEAVRLSECKALGTFQQQKSTQRLSDLNSNFYDTEMCIQERRTVT